MPRSTNTHNSAPGRLLEVFSSPISHNSSRHSVNTGLHGPIRSTMQLHLHLITLFLLSSAPGAAIASNLRAAAGLEDRALQGKLDPDDLGFVWKLYPSKKFDDRGDDYGVMCRGKECEKNDNIVTGHINNNLDYMRWEYIPHPNIENAGQMKTKTKNLCLTHARTDNKDHDYVLRKCDNADENQLFVGFSHTEKFKLHPYGRGKDYEDYCISMLHRPRSNGDDDGEVIIDQGKQCLKPIKTETVYWIAQYRPRIKEEIGFKDMKCKNNDKCREVRFVRHLRQHF